MTCFVDTCFLGDADLSRVQQDALCGSAADNTPQVTTSVNDAKTSFIFIVDIFELACETEVNLPTGNDATAAAEEEDYKRVKRITRVIE